MLARVSLQIVFLVATLMGAYATHTVHQQLRLVSFFHEAL